MLKGGGCLIQVTAHTSAKTNTFDFICTFPAFPQNWGLYILQPLLEKMQSTESTDSL